MFKIVALCSAVMFMMLAAVSVIGWNFVYAQPLADEVYYTVEYRSFGRAEAGLRLIDMNTGLVSGMMGWDSDLARCDGFVLAPDQTTLAAVCLDIQRGWQDVQFGRIGAPMSTYTHTETRETETDLVWMPDGAHLVFRAFDDDIGGTQQWTLTTLDTATQTTTVISAPNLNTPILWSPDRTVALMVTTYDNNPPILVYVLEARTGRVIYTQAINWATLGLRTFAWSADGESILFQALDRQTGTTPLIRMHLTNGTVERIADLPYQIEQVIRVEAEYTDLLVIGNGAVKQLLRIDADGRELRRIALTDLFRMVVIPSP